MKEYYIVVIGAGYGGQVDTNTAHKKGLNRTYRKKYYRDYRTYNF